MDTRTGCSAGLFALATGALYLGAGAERVLVVGAETFSKIIPPEHKVAALALGDGAGAWCSAVVRARGFDARRICRPTARSAG